MRNPWLSEPVAIATAVRAIILCGVSFGLNWTGEQIASTMLAVEAILGVLTRQSVMAPSTIHEAGMTVRGIKEVAVSNVEKAEAKAAAQKSPPPQV